MAEAVVAEKKRETPEVVKKITVGASASVEDVLQWNAAEAYLVFEQKEDYLPLDDKIINLLSRENRTRYMMAKDFHDTWRGDDHKQFVESFQIDRQNLGSASEKLQVKTSKTLQERWVRPDNMARMEAMGYRVAHPDEVQTFLPSKNGHVEVGSMGRTEMVLMVTDKKKFDAAQATKARTNSQKALAWKGSGAKDVTAAGVQAYDPETDKAKRSWNELTPSES